MLRRWRDYSLIKKSGFFDPAYYLLEYPDCRQADVDPLRHFVTVGWKDKRNPSTKFNTGFYLELNPDVRSSGINPLVHYLRFGRREGRLPAPGGGTTLPNAQPPASKMSHRLRKSIYRLGKRIYWRIPPKIRQRLLDWVFGRFGFLFHDFFAYQEWANRAGRVNILNLHQDNFIDLRQVEPARQVEGTIAVSLHVFYPDLVNEFAGYLKNMPFPYDLFISVTSDEGHSACSRAFAQLPFCNKLVIKMVPNRGRDVAPMFTAFGGELKKYDFVAHLHSKKSIYNQGASQGWREYLCNALFGSEDRLRRIFSLLQGPSPHGLVYPQNYIFVPVWANTWLANRAQGQAWCARLGFGEAPPGYFDFPVSSMFWARRQALAPLFNAGITLDDFPVEAGQTDGTLAHCMERLFGLSSSRQGLPVAVLRDEEFTTWSPWRFDQYTDRSYGSMLRSFQDPAIKVIGFDIFDTLLCRPLLDPESIKTIVARRFGEALGQQYMQFRPLAEQQARRQKGADVSLDEIYASLTVLTNIPSPALLEIKKIELSVETSSLSPRPGALNLFKDAVATGKPVALITDMFLPRSSIETTLKNFGFDGWSGFYVSGEIGLRKDAGSLYLHVLEHFHVKPSEFLMVGDNERSDIQIPSDMGASFLHLLKPVELARGLPRFASFIHDQERSKDLEAELTLGLVVKENFSPISYEAFDPESLFQVDPHAQGYSVIGPLLAAFSQWLLEASRQDNIERLYFLSREGRLMKEAFDLWCKGESRLPATEYLVVSRRAAGAAAIFAFEDILEVARIDYFPNTAENFLNTRYGLLLDDDRWEDLEKKIGWKKKTSVQVTEKNIDAVMPLLNFLKAEILARAEVEREALIRLLAEKGLDQNDHQAVVDIGFGGSVQRYLNKLLSRKVHGYYMITDERAGAVASACNVFLKGCFLEQVQRNDAAPMLYRRSFNLEKYLSSGEPQLEFYEIDSSGCVTGHFHDLTDQEKSMLQLRKDIHKGALDYVADSLHIRSTMLPDFRPSVQISAALAQAFLSWNSPGELNFLSQILLDDYYCGRGLVL